MEGATEKWNQWEPTEMYDRKKDGGSTQRGKDLDCLGVELSGLRLGCRVHTFGQELMFQVPRQNNFSRKTVLLGSLKCLDTTHLDQKNIYPHLHSNS